MNNATSFIGQYLCYLMIGMVVVGVIGVLVSCLIDVFKAYSDDTFYAHDEIQEEINKLKP